MRFERFLSERPYNSMQIRYRDNFWRWRLWKMYYFSCLEILRSINRSNFQWQDSMFPLTNSKIAWKTLNAIMLKILVCCWKSGLNARLNNEVGWLCWGLTSQSTIFQSYRDGAIASWVINQYFRGVKCLAQGHNTAAVGLEPRTSRSGVRHSTTEPPRYPK